MCVLIINNLSAVTNYYSLLMSGHICCSSLSILNSERLKIILQITLSISNDSGTFSNCNQSVNITRTLYASRTTAKMFGRAKPKLIGTYTTKALVLISYDILSISDKLLNRQPIK